MLKEKVAMTMLCVVALSSGVFGYTMFDMLRKELQRDLQIAEQYGTFKVYMDMPLNKLSEEEV